MDCNKEEASRAKTLAEIKMRNGDFVGAHKLVMKAQSLFSDIENLPQMLAVCDVHISAEKKINGLENWYGILQVMHFSDESAIKKQYRKLSLLLHPDKNQFFGAEDAFKLVWEASRLLCDKEKRFQYDVKHRIYSRIAGNQLSATSGQQCAAANNDSDSRFWTCCEHCGYRYKYKKEYVNSLLYCSNCKKSYKAYDTGANVVPPKSSTGQKEVRNRSSISKTDQEPCMNKDKDTIKVLEEPVESINADVSDIFEDVSDSKSNKSKKKSPRKRQQNSHAEGRNDDSISPPTKRTRSSVGLKSDRATKKQNLCAGSSKRLDSDGTSAPSSAYKGKAKKNMDSESGKCEASREGVVITGIISNNHKANEKLITQDLPDPDFNNFEPTKSCFAVNQVWSLYDSTDGMPRFYARIDKVLDSEFKLWITWMDPVQDNKDNSIPITCGIFLDGDSEEVNDHLMFSCQMLHLSHNYNIIIHPRKGEIWGVFRGWDISWSASAENHKRPYEYDYVEVLSDFKAEDGLGVAYMGKVDGFVSLFRRDVQNGVLQLQIPPSEMLRFSHKVPSFKMTGKEREGVPPGCFELDTAALPKDMFEVDNSKVDVPNGKTGGLLPKADSCRQPGEYCISDEILTTPKKPEKIITTDSSRNRKTPQDIHMGENGELLSQSRVNGLLKSETCVPTSCTTRKQKSYNFEKQRSCDKFQINQVWAMYSNDNGIPRKYGQIKKIDTMPEFKLHVAPLDPYRPPELTTHPICCGLFKLKTGKAEVLVPSNFSHQVKTLKHKNIFEVNPEKGEIWGLYKNWNITEEFEIVEVVETNEQSIKVMYLIAKGINKNLYDRSQESKNILKTEVIRFSHQIPAFRHERRSTRFGTSEYWELDPKAFLDFN